MKNSLEIRDHFFKFWSNAPRNSREIPNSSLVPKNDPTLLFVNSGMFPIVPYLSGEPHPMGKRLHNVQRCIRTNDIEEVGDNRHMVMFEMLGNWSLGDFTKEQQIPWIMEFYVDICKLDPKRIYVSVFAGDDSAQRDDVAIELWKKTFAKYGIDAEFSADISNIPESIEDGRDWKYRIFPFDKKKNWWCRAEVPGEIGGPTSEVFYDMGQKERDQEQYNINDDSGRFIEIGNNVFMEFSLDKDMKWIPLNQKNIDFGGGLERIVIASQNNPDPFTTDLFINLIKKIEELSGKTYVSKIKLDEEIKSFRVLAEHARSSTFLIADGVLPSNKDQGYILRRLIRRMIRHALRLGIKTHFCSQLVEIVVNDYESAYPHLKENKNLIIEQINIEESKFNKTLLNGLKYLSNFLSSEDTLSKFNGKDAFGIYETYGFPLELIIEELEGNFRISEKQKTDIINEFKQEENIHKLNSKAGAEVKFKGGLADTSQETTKLHTAHHLLLAAMQKLISLDIKQKGSNITADRLRMDFNFDRKLTNEEIKNVEDLVNQKINDCLHVLRVEMQKDKAEEIAAEMEFGQKYPDIVSIYFITDTQPGHGDIPKNWFSAEFCGGPHVKNTKELSEGNKKFRIVEQESIGSGLRRIKAKLM